MLCKFYRKDNRAFAILLSLAVIEKDKFKNVDFCVSFLLLFIQLTNVFCNEIFSTICHHVQQQEITNL